VPHDLNAETYQTETLFSYDGCSEHSLMSNSGQPRVYKNHVYLPIIAHGRVPRILQVPLDGRSPTKIGRIDPEFHINDDAHCYFVLDIDNDGYIHLTGGMHGHPWNYWISEKPEDISNFVRATGKQLPPGTGITYPRFIKDRSGNLYLHARASVPWADRKNIHTGLLSMYDHNTRSWRAIGTDIPAAFGGKPNFPVTIWEDNFENGSFYAINSANFVQAADGTMHFGFAVLNRSPREYKKPPAFHSTTELMYAVSKDGGKTLQRQDGSNVVWPVRAEAGPHRPDLVFAEPEDNQNPWFDPGADIQLDWKSRPLIQATRDKRTKKITFRMEDGKWAPCPEQAYGSWRDRDGVLMDTVPKSTDVIRLWDENNFRIVKLGQEVHKLDENHLSETGTMIYTTKGGGRAGNTVINVMRTTIQRPQSAEGK
jgi:hypothetical protein